MITNLMRKLIVLFFLIYSFNATAQKSIVKKYGRLQVKGSKIVGENGKIAQLRGVSLFWSQWKPQYYNPQVVKWLKNDWKCTVIRAALGVENGGYLKNPEKEQKKVEKVIEACINQGLYVIIDYHAHEAHKNIPAAQKFFAAMAQKYGHHPNIIYETYNEPLEDTDWNTVIKPYHQAVLNAIRKYDPDNLVICGSRTWSQRVDEAAANRVIDKNVAYTLHYYADSHKDELRTLAQRALDTGLPLFVTEQGNCDASGNGILNKEEALKWYEFLDYNKISWVKWSVADKEETASILKPGSNSNGKWKEKDLTPSGQFVRDQIRSKNILEIK